MQDLGTAAKLKWWPSLQDYNEAIQIPAASLQDPELRRGLPYTSALGLPRPVTGSFASVYRMHCHNKDYALRLFLRNFENQAKRYALISNFVQNDSIAYTLSFNFLPNGLKIRGEWFPALKMEWVEGTPFEDYIVENLRNSKKLGALLSSFVQMMTELRGAGIAHGDLQHGNIIMCKNEIRLVDYDGMFVPAMKNFTAGELGHPNYQHAGRADKHFGPYLDNFSAWIIYASIRALQIDPALLNQLGGGDDCLLFRRSDFIEPLQSPAFAAFERHSDKELQILGRFIRAQLIMDVTQIPYLQEPVPEIHDALLTEISDAVSNIKSGPRIIRSVPSDCLPNEDAVTIFNVDYNSTFDYQYTSFNQPQKLDLKQKTNCYQYSEPIQPSKKYDGSTSWIVQAQAVQPAAWVKPNSKDFVSSNITSTVSSKTDRLIPPELLIKNSKRAIVFDKRTDFQPIINQCLMLINPLVWIMVGYFATACTTDEDLRLHAKDYDANVTSVSRYVTYSKNSTDHHTDVNAEYTVNGTKFETQRDMGEDNGRYKKGQVYSVRAMASKPLLHEPLDSKAGTKKSDDIRIGLLYTILNLLLEWLIWHKPLLHRNFAKKGLGVMVQVADLQVGQKKDGSPLYVVLKYEIRGTNYSTQLTISRAQYIQLIRGSYEAALYDPTDPTKIILYKFCMYKPAFQPLPPVKSLQANRPTP